MRGYGITWLLPLVLVLSSCEGDVSKNTAQQEYKAKPAKLLQISVSDEERYLDYPAIIKSQHASSLSFEVSGVIKELMVVESQEVLKGTSLAIIDTRDLQEKLKSAQAEFDIANSEYERTQRLMQSGAISKIELEQKKSKRDVSRTTLASAQKAIEDATLIAPFSGNVAEILIRKDQAIQAGETAMVMIGLEVFEAEINLPASIIALAERKTDNGNNAYVTFSFAPDQRFPAKFREATLNADTDSQTYRVAFVFETPDNLNILPGMTARLWFKNPTRLQETQGEIRIPITAVGIDGLQKYVWVVDPISMQVSRRNVVIANTAEETLVVKDGLKRGETIVVSGISLLSKGMKVRAWSHQ